MPEKAARRRGKREKPGEGNEKKKNRLNLSIRQRCAGESHHVTEPEPSATMVTGEDSSTWGDRKRSFLQRKDASLRQSQKGGLPTKGSLEKKKNEGKGDLDSSGDSGGKQRGQSLEPKKAGREKVEKKKAEEN